LGQPACSCETKKRIRQRIDNIRFKTGDVLLLQGRTHNLNNAVTSIECLPLAERGLKIGQPRKIILAVGIFGIAIAAVVAGLLPVQIAFTIAAVLLVLTNVVSVREIYTSID